MGACTVASVRDAMDELLELPIEGACACVEHNASDDVAPALAAYARRVAEAGLPVRIVCADSWTAARYRAI